MFIGYPNNSNFVKNTPLRVAFSTLFSVFGYPDETLSLAFDILLKQKINDITIKLKEDHKISLEKIKINIVYRVLTKGNRSKGTKNLTKYAVKRAHNSTTSTYVQKTFSFFFGSRLLRRRNRWLEMEGVERGL